MTESAPEPAPPVGRQGALVEGRPAVIAALRTALLQACAKGEREIRCVAASFEDWPLDDAELLQALVSWARPAGRQLLMIGRDFDGLARRHPRFAAWRRDWSHRFEARQPGEHERMELPTFIVAGSTAFELIDVERWRGRLPATAAEWQRLREEIDAIAQRCEPAWPPTTLGL